MPKRARGWGRTTLITLGLVCRTLNWVPTKLRLSSPLEKGLLALSRAITEIFFYLLNFSIPDFLHWVRPSILLITYSPFMIQVSISFGFCLKVLIESMVKLSVLTSLFFACKQRWAAWFLAHCSFRKHNVTLTASTEDCVPLANSKTFIHSLIIFTEHPETGKCLR